MSIFISDELFEIKIHFQSILDNNGHSTGVTICQDDNDSQTQTLICQVAGRDFENMSKILENASIINHINGQTLIRKSVFYRSLILKFFKSWNLYDEHGKMVPIENHIISKMHDSIVRELGKKWLNMTSGGKK